VVLGLYLHLLDTDGRRHPRPRRQGHQAGIGHLRATQQSNSRYSRSSGLARTRRASASGTAADDPYALQALGLAPMASRLRLKAAQRASSTSPNSRPASVRPGRRCPRAGTAVLGAAGEHAVRFGDAARDEVVDQHAEVGLVPGGDQAPRNGVARALMPASRPAPAALRSRLVPLIWRENRPAMDLVSNEP